MANLRQYTEMPDLANRSISRDTANELAKKAGIGRSRALVIRLYYEEERQKAKERMSIGGKGGNEEGSANLHTLEMGKDVAEILAKKAGIYHGNQAK